MDYSQFSSLFDKVKGRKMSPQEAASTLMAQQSAPALLKNMPAKGIDEKRTLKDVRTFFYDDPYLRDHLVDGEQVLIGVTYASLAIDYFFSAYPEHDGVHLHGLEFVRPVRVGPQQAARIRIAAPASSVTGAAQSPSTGWAFHAMHNNVPGAPAEIVASGKLQAMQCVATTIDLAALKASLKESNNVADIYTSNAALTLGESFKTIARLYVGEKQVLARVVLPQKALQSDAYLLHPLLINSAFLGLTPLVAQYYKADMFLPFGIRDIVSRKVNGLASCWLLMTLVKKTDELILFDVDLVDDDANVVARFEGCALKRRRSVSSLISAAPMSVTSKNSENNSENLYDLIQQYVIQKIAAVSNMDAAALDLQRNIMDMGMASAQLIEVGAVIQAEMAIELYPTLFFEYTNIKELTDYFYAEHTEKFSGLLDKKTQTTRTSPAQPAAVSSVQPQSAISTESPKKTGDLSNEPIAIIGMHGRFAQADNLEQFWENLWNAKDVMREIPPDHWDYRPWFDADMDAPDKTYCKWGSFIDDVDQFDAGFFNISRREAEWMDPQVRMLLQSVYATADDAGYSSRLRGTNTGVFVGACFHDYQSKIDELNLPVNPYVGVNNTHTVMANRISYHFDLTGPSITVDTACSSSLVALHQACQALRNGECDVAFVCGANLLLSSMHYRVFSSLKALSPTGRCHSFDAAADGYVPGECIASILLKPLSQAIRDGDHIEAIVKGTAALHGGYTPSFTAPSVAGELNVILKAWEDAGVDPETISYIEAHGTGTKLGDPIEVNSLKNAFAQLTQKQNFCAIGSAKANIGHAEGAAGLAGVLKVILQMKHRKIPPLMAFNKLNPYVSLDKSALRLDPAGHAWDSPPGVPRRSGVSSFGVAGAYAHVVLEEYLEDGAAAVQNPDRSQTAVAIVLSAKTEPTLRDQAQELLHFIRAGKLSDDALESAAYTLQTGRQAMDVRLAMLVDSVSALEEKLSRFLQRQHTADLYHGSAKRTHDGVPNPVMALSAPEMRAMSEDWIAQGGYGKLLEHWVNGLSVNWRQLHVGRKVRVISLPTYPFAQESYWLPEADLQENIAPTGASVGTHLHPLLHENVSDLSAQRYRTRLSGEEFFLDDHRVRGEKVLPGVAYLEMARAALAHATGHTGQAGKENTPILLTNIVWLRPIVLATEPRDIYIAFDPTSSAVLAYEIYSLDEADAAHAHSERLVYSRGNAQLNTSASSPSAALPTVLDLAALRIACGERTVFANAFYQRISSMGLELGQRLQGIEVLHIGADRLLAKLHLPAKVSTNVPTSMAPHAEQYVLHPSLMDSSLQACAALLLGEANATAKLALPYAMETLEVLQPCRAQMWAFIQFSDKASSHADGRNLDIDLCDEDGHVCVRMRGLAFRMLASAPRQIAASAAARSVSHVSNGSNTSAEPAVAASKNAVEPHTLLARRDWKAVALTEAMAPAYAVHEILLCDLDAMLVEGVMALPGTERRVQWGCKGMGVAQDFQQLAEQVLKNIQEIFHQSADGLALLQIVFVAGPQRKIWQALSALLKTAQMENTRFFGQMIEIDAATDAPLLMAQCRENSRSFDHQICYEDGVRKVLTSCEVESDSRQKMIPWKHTGVYLITGGAGDLGLLLAQEIAQRVTAPHLILTGRSVLNDQQKKRLTDLQALGSNIDYCQVDVTNRSAVAELIGRIVATHGYLNGIIHCAGVLQDELIHRRNADELSRGMAAKVQGLVNLDEMSKALPLDFFLMFSSIAGVLGNAGQADYALGNAFMDGYAHYRVALAEAKLRSGRTLSVNWPLWRHGGMRPNDAMEALLGHMYGLTPLENRAGLDALYQCLAIEAAQLMVLSGYPEKIRDKVLPARLPAFAQSAMTVATTATTAITTAAPLETTTNLPERNAASAPQKDSGELRQKIVNMLVQKSARVLKMRPDDIDVHAELDTLGFNSIALTELTNIVNREFGLELTPTVFYEHTTLSGFGGYLLAQHQEAFAASAIVPSAVPSAIPFQPVPTRFADAGRDREKLPQAVSSPGPTDTAVARAGNNAADDAAADVADDDAVAIIGMSGCFPMARNLSEFWSNLVEGKDCISEIPAERWDWQAIYGDPQQGTNKSNVKWGGFIDGIAEFDPLFFGISPREAAFMDPQQRLLMTHTWLAIEDAGYSAQSLSGTNTAIFVGTTATGYGELLNQRKAQIEAYSATGIVPSVGPNRMSYFLNLHGPSEPIETACSSALVALHRGVQLIRHGSCDMALVGGVNTILSPELHMSFNKAGMLSEDGRCKTFSADANGFARGEGAGMMFLKKLKAAEQDGDPIYGVIRGTSQNHGGRAKSLTAPNPKAQAALLTQAYTEAGIDPRTVGYIETHGTGTALGDPIEIDGLKLAFRQLSSVAQDQGSNQQPKHLPSSTAYCGIGSVKSNVGHLELAAGVAGVFKVLLQLKHKTLAKTLHCDVVNPYIQLKDSPFYIVQESTPWKALRDANGAELPRRAGVSSFGFGGANCHVVIEEYIDRRATTHPAAVNEDHPAVVVLSAKNAERLREQVAQLRDFLNASSTADQQLHQIAYTLQVGREAMETRLAMVAGSVTDLQEKLAHFLAGTHPDDFYQGQVSRNNDMLALFSGDDALQEAVGKWLQQRKFSKLLRLWVQGLPIDWDGLYAGAKPGRMSLPAYPFSRDCYWVPKADTHSARPVQALPEAQETDQQHHATNDATTDATPMPDRRTNKVARIESSRERRTQQSVKYFMEKAWQPSTEAALSRPIFSAPDGEHTVAREIVIVCNAETKGLAEVVRKRLYNGHVLDLSDPQSAHKIPLSDREKYDGCIDLIGCGNTRQDPMAQIKLVQELIEHGVKDEVTLLCVTKRLEAPENGVLNMSGASIVGLYRMLQSEYRTVRSRHMDAEMYLPDESLADQIVAEYLLDSRSVEVCYRNGRRLVATFKENPRWAKASAKLHFAPENVLWISGGTRGLGYLCAQHFVATYGVKRLVLSGREEIPLRDQWDAYRNERSPLADKIRSFLALENQGVQLLVLSVCLSDQEAMQSCVARIQSTLGNIGGVVHCAGAVSTENAAFMRKSPEELRSVVEPKVAGLDVFFSQVSKAPLQFFVLFSSVSAVIPSLASGLSDYAMANAYMDYFAQSKFAKHPVVSIQWPQWKESGMGGVTGKAYDRTGLLRHTDADGLAMLDAILSNPIGPVVMPATVNPTLWQPAQLMQSAIDAEAGISKVVPISVPARQAANAPNADVPSHSLQSSIGGTNSAINSAMNAAITPAKTPEAFTMAVERWLTGFFAEELRIAAKDLRADIPFQEYGMESVMLAQVVGRMERNLKTIKIDPSLILENPTIRQLAAHLSHAHPEAFAALLESELGLASISPSAQTETQAVTQSVNLATPTPASIAQRTENAVPPMQATASSGEKFTSPISATTSDDRVAIVGLSGHFPDAPDLTTFWQNLMSKKDSMKEVPQTRWDSSVHYRPGKMQSGKSVSKWGAFMDRIEDFDPGYFKISDSLALQMDPLERQWLEVSAEALADAGYGDGQLWGKKVGVFVGARSSNYRDKLTSIDKDVVVGLGQNFIAAHLAHIYNFKGPNFVVDAACASSLTAIHLAVQSIRHGESDMALAGGVEVLLDESPYVVLSTAQVLSPGGRCKTFDESADGIGLGEGCAVLVLKSLQKAILDGDKIYGVIDGSAINNDGNTMGITTPNPSAQSELIETAIAVANIDPATISYVETHGTGTLIGDPIELNALTKIFNAHSPKKQFCGVGSVKSNIGHLLSAAGGASMVKVLLAIIHRQLPPTIHCDHPNPRFNFAQSALYLVTNPTDWHGDGTVLRAGVSSFGLGGNNAHVIVSDEGIPAHLRASLAPRGKKVVFNRKRYWPEVPAAPVAAQKTHVGVVRSPDPAGLEAPWVEKIYAPRSTQDMAMFHFFEVQEVSENDDLDARDRRSIA